MHITVAAKVYCKEQDTEKCLVCVKKLVQTLVYTWDMQLYVQYIPMYMECNNVNLEILVYENIYVLNGRVNKFSWMTHNNAYTIQRVNKVGSSFYMIYIYKLHDRIYHTFFEVWLQWDIIAVSILHILYTLFSIYILHIRSYIARHVLVKDSNVQIMYR